MWESLFSNHIIRILHLTHDILEIYPQIFISNNES